MQLATLRRGSSPLRNGAAAILLPLLVIAWILVTGAGGEFFVLAVDDIGEAVYAAAAAAAAAWRATRLAPGQRRHWIAVSIGCGGWAAGEAVWAWYELVAGREMPFPSLADAGFLVFPVAMCVALWCWPSGRAGLSRPQLVLDGLTVAAALTLVWWATALGAVTRAGAEDTWSFVVSLAYPATDLVVVTMCVIVLAASRRVSSPLLLMGGGLIAFTVSDSVFAWLVATGAEWSAAGSLGWFVGFALLALAPLAVGEDGDDAQRRPDDAVHTPSRLPYVPVVVAVVVVTLTGVGGGVLGPVDFALGGVTIVLVLVRQFVTMSDNARLVQALADREAQLRHQAFHDALTGLANRALFHDRVAHALDLHDRDLRALGVLFCDLDDFKLINDTLGHAAGDQLLVRVAERLRGALRAGDTLARLGGDEFAVLLEDGGEPLEVAGKLLSSLREPFVVGGSRVSVRASIGVAAVPADGATPSIDELIGRADTAMYAVKRNGKDNVRGFEPGTELVDSA